MKFISTRNMTPKFDFIQAVEMGLAPDGGLFVPEEFPSFQVDDFKDLNFTKIATDILRVFLSESFTISQIDTLTSKAFSFPIVLKKLSEQTSILELFHGPTAAFKDVAAQFLGELLGTIRRGEKTILVATSGDTGGAVAAAFNERPGFRVVILFPKDGVSPLQKQQLTCWGPNIFSLAVDGSFDDCQQIVKSLLAQPKTVAQFGLTSANSINIARLLPQTTYYAAASLWWQKAHQKKAQFVIPTGNMGNAVAAFWAQKMGFPIEKIVMATNANSAVSHFYQTGEFNPHPSIATLANAMDVGNPSNFERLKSLYPELGQLRLISEARAVSDEQIKKTIVKVHREIGEIICPHTATAMAVRESLPGDWIVVATAHPAKFTEIVEPLIQKPVPLPKCLESLRTRPSQWTDINASEEAVFRILHQK